MDDIEQILETRLGRLHARQRLGIETDHEAQIFGQGFNFFHLENFTASHRLIRAVLIMTGLYGRGQRNAARLELTHNDVRSRALPREFDGFTLLQLSDLHTDMSGPAMDRMLELLSELAYDLCVITGDFRGHTFGPFADALDGMEKVRSVLRPPIYGVLGNHDTVRMLPRLEELGITMLMNESVTLERGGARIHLAGVDDAHFYRMDSIAKAAEKFSHQEFSILLSHTPEIFRQAAHADFDLMLCGHTHGGQICLPGGIPITLAARLPRAKGKGEWTHHGMQGYTSRGAGTAIVPVRFNCPPEITLHHLHSE